VYLDKPMRNHTRMQTIARANRVFPGKHSGLIVDYANVFASLERALAIYGAGKDGASPVRDKSELVGELEDAVQNATRFCEDRGVDLGLLERAPVGSLSRLQSLEDGVEALISPDQVRNDFLARERLVGTLFGAVKPDPAALKFALRASSLLTLAEAIKARIGPNPADISAIMGGIASILDESITGITIKDGGPPPIDLSLIDFDTLSARFKESNHKKTELEALKAAIRARLEKLVLLNPTRVNFTEKLEALIEAYNSGSRNIEELFDELLSLSRGLDEEQDRHVRENMTEEELVIFDILTRPEPELNDGEKAEVKKVARDFLIRIKELLVLNWRQKTEARSKVNEAIKDVLDAGLPRAYTPELYRAKCAKLFEHMYERYPERDTNVYSQAG
jgi:type I restriction enzyme, R subunit